MNEYQESSFHKLDPDCEHEFEEWELTSESGIAFCDWTCKHCMGVVSQLLAERTPPPKGWKPK